MTWEIGLLLGIIAVAVVLFSLERISPDIIGLGLVILLALTGLIPQKRAFEGFGSDTVITILGLLILTAALLRTGVIEIAGRTIVKYTGQNPNHLLLVIMITAAGLGAFISNTAATAFFVPLVMGVADRTKVSPSKLLLPLAFSSILTSSVTLISTSTNLVVSGLMTQANLKPIGMFELAPVGIPIAVVGLLYMFFIGRRLIPSRTHPGDLIGEFGIRPYLSELVVLPSSTFIGKTLEEAALGRDLDLTVVQIIRDKNEILLPRRDLMLKEGDVLLVEGKTEHLLKIKDTAGIDIKADVKLSDPNLQSENVSLVEAILMPKSPLIGRTLKGYRFRERYGLQVLGLNRHGENLRRKLSQTPLRMGDMLLLQGSPQRIGTLQDENDRHTAGRERRQDHEPGPRRTAQPSARAPRDRDFYRGARAGQHQGGRGTTAFLSAGHDAWRGPGFCDALHHPRGSVSRSGMESGHSHRQHARARRGHAGDRHRHVPGRIN
jgi:di/tricarboxylate transporter